MTGNHKVEVIAHPTIYYEKTYTPDMLRIINSASWKFDQCWSIFRQIFSG